MNLEQLKQALDSALEENKAVSKALDEAHLAFTESFKKVLAANQAIRDYDKEA